MVWGSYESYHKRRRNEDTLYCQDCDEPFDAEQDEWLVCGECEATLCEHCMNTSCAVCKENGGEGTEGETCCENCQASCEDCGDSIVFHKGCRAAHLASCNAKSRAQRAAATATQTVTDKEAELKRAKNVLTDAQSRVARLEAELEHARTQKTTADAQLVVEETSKPVPAQVPSQSS